MNRTCDAHYILVKKPAKMTGEARNVAADWLVVPGAVVRYRVCGESVGMFASNNRRRRIIIRRRGRRNADGIPKRKSDGIIEAWDCRRSVAAFHILRKISRNLWPNASKTSAFIENKFKPLYETRVFEVLACANPAYPSAPSPLPYDEAKALQTYVKNETEIIVARVFAIERRAIEGEIPSPDADGFEAVNAVQVMETRSKGKR